MAILEILKYPDPRLRTVAKAITVFDDKLKAMVQDMYDTMYDANGVGLAGTQVNIHLQIFTMDTSDDRSAPRCVINPQVISQEGMQYDYHGCLSVGDRISDKLQRAAKIHIRGVDETGKPIELMSEGLEAICIQHEMDHLVGKLFIDHLSKLKFNRIKKKLEKAQRWE